MTKSRVDRSRSQRSRGRGRPLMPQPLEPRRMLAASFGWDGPGQGSAALTYTISNAPASLSPAEVDAAIATAFNAWSSVADLTFTKVNQVGLRDSIDISFTNIDGAGRTLAQAYFPDDVNPARIAGDIQFDVSEVWEIGNGLGHRAFDLVWVAVHEIGHALGLDHDHAAGSVLEAFVSPNQRFTGLGASDVSAIRGLYAAAGTGVSNTPPTIETPVSNPTDPTDPGDTDDDPFPRFRWRRGGWWWRFGGRLDADGPENQNPYAPTDTNGDGVTSARDALVVINQLNRGDETDLGLGDVNGDGVVSARDALMVINALNQSEVVTPPSVNNVSLEPNAQLGDDDTDDGPLTDAGDLADEEELDREGDLGHDHLAPDRWLPGEVGGIASRFLRGGVDRVFSVLDTNDDGSLTEAEVPDFVWSFLVDLELDTNADDAISTDEVDAYFAGYLAARREERFARRDTNDDGVLTEDEVSSRRWEKIVLADANQDGGVSLEELQAWHANRAPDHREPPISPVVHLIDNVLTRLSDLFNG